MWIMAGDENIDHEDEMQQEDHFYFKQDSRDKKKNRNIYQGPVKIFWTQPMSIVEWGHQDLQR